MPYQVYDGHGLLIGGMADLAAVTELLKDEQLYPIHTADGRALMAIWVCDFSEASLGPHTELQFSLAVSHRPTAPANNRALSLIRVIFSNPEARLLCHGLWNNTAIAVAYNQELLGLDARLSDGGIRRENSQMSFTFVDEQGAPIFEGRVAELARTPGKTAWELLRLLGLRQSLRAAGRQAIGTRVVNPISETLPVHADAEAYLAPDANVVQFFDPAADWLTFGQEPYRSLGFRPQYYQHFSPFRFVYLLPEKV